MASRLKIVSDRLKHTERPSAGGEACKHFTHTMRNLMASLRTLAQYERDALNGDTNAKAAFDHIISTANTMETWLRHLLITSRPMKPKPARQPIEPLLRDSLSLLQPNIAEGEIQIQFEPAESIPYVNVDRALLQQALVAVLTNAIDASPDRERITIAPPSSPMVP